jgi:sec-independent protein translocase protein TatA
MFTGLASPSHLIVVLAILLLLFGAKRIPELAKGLGTGIKEFREGISSSDDAKPEGSESEMPHHKARRESEARDDQTLRTHAGQRGSS